MQLNIRTAVTTLIFLLSFSGIAVFAANLPACNSQILTRHGREVSMNLSQLSNTFNQKLKASHSHFTDLHLSAQRENTLQVSGKDKGQPMSITGPLRTNSSGGLQLHADQITRNGAPVGDIMGFLGETLSDYVTAKDSPSLSVQGSNLDIHVDKLLNLSGRVKNVRLRGSTLKMRFASQPCQ